MTKIEFNEAGDLVSFSNGKTPFCTGTDGDGIFRLMARDLIGRPYQLSRKDFRHAEAKRTANGWEAVYSDCPPLRGSVVKIRVETAGEETLWRIEAHPGSGHCCTEWVDFPRLRLKHHMDEAFLTPFAEGTIIRDLRQREKKANFKSAYTEYPHTGVRNFYPGPAAMQFQAYFTGEEGLYVGCDDPSHAPKTLDFYPDGEGDDGITMVQCFTNGEPSPGYPVVTRFFTGDWQAAAEIYRQWMEKKDPVLPSKLDGVLPDWMMDSPVVVGYPVRGNGLDWDKMEPNEYFPYVNALPVLEKYRRRWHAPLLALLMHWEGTAPWAPPYVWPPYGGEDRLKAFTDALHAAGDHIGLYASGIGWTQRSNLEKSYDRTEDFQKMHVDREICKGPLGESYSRVCCHAQGIRIGYDLCPSREFTHETACHEIESARAAGIDYMQYFDQNQGAAAPLCYSKEHGHPSLPGAWHTDAMRELLADAQKSAGEMVIGCENAAAEPYMEYCRMNDLRTHIAWGACGTPVPLYSYLFHEYCAGFTGNGVCLSNWVDLEHTPFFHCWNLGWNFVNGSWLSVILKDGGLIHWHWSLSWQVEPPEQEPINQLVENLTRWRRGAAKPYLTTGRMIPLPELSSRSKKITLCNRLPEEVPAILAAHWEKEGKRALLFVNYGKEEEFCRIDVPAAGKLLARGSETAVAKGMQTLSVPPLDAVMIEY